MNQGFGYLIAAVLALLANQAVAQSLGFDANAVQAVCGQSGSACQKVTLDALDRIARADLTDAALNTQLGALAAAVAAGAETTPQDQRIQISQSLMSIADLSTDKRQAQSINDLAGQIAQGKGRPLEALEPVGSSPA
ncbi:hypothetical protein [Parasulfitobacter algicola]|uniref:Uncharacterized protein n=1 Tax=Parasulfitobacter algicola TaxID=2614809 RepID=A0ABX2ITM1_9RHOB|nr:hypothetical protein [Sulfitobacter algicola]NSX53518.1 hypothetical protein [Sulfitobacter algicola]